MSTKKKKKDFLNRQETKQNEFQIKRVFDFDLYQQKENSISYEIRLNVFGL